MRPFLRSAALAATMFAAGACLPSGAGETRIVVDIRHSKFVPSEISVRSNSKVTFVVRNHDPIDHEFILGDDEVQERHERGTEKEHGAIPGEVSVPSGERATTTFTFTGTGTLIFGCHAPGHYDYGMRGTVIIA